MQNFSTEVNLNYTSWTDTGITLAITPISTSNKVLAIVAANAEGYVGASTYRVYDLNLVRTTTELMSKSCHIGAVMNPTNSYVYGAMDGTMVYLDSPSSTSAITYKVQLKHSNTGNNCNVRINGGSAESTLTLMEIAG